MLPQGTSVALYDLFRVRDPWRFAATCGGSRMCLVSWANDAPMVTGVIRCHPVIRGPDVAPSRPWPHPVRHSKPCFASRLGWRGQHGMVT